MEIILVAEWFEFPFGIKPWGCLSLGPLLANSGETVLDNLILMKSPTWGFTCKLVRITNQHNSITLSSLSYFWSSDHCSRFLKCPRTRVKVRPKWRFIIFLIHKWGICVDINSIHSFRVYLMAHWTGWWGFDPYLKPLETTEEALTSHLEGHTCVCWTSYPVEYAPG